MGVLLVLAALATLGAPILFTPGWRSFLICLALYVALAGWITYETSLPAGPCTDPATCGGSMAGFLIGAWLRTAVWIVLGLFAFAKVIMLAGRRN